MASKKRTGKTGAKKSSSSKRTQKGAQPRARFARARPQSQSKSKSQSRKRSQSKTESQSRSRLQSRRVPGSRYLTDSEIEKRAAKRRADYAKAQRAARKQAATVKGKRARVEKFEREAMMLRSRVKELRPYVEGFEAAAGFDMRKPKEVSVAQRRKVKAAYRKLAPLLVKPHVRVRPKNKAALKVLTDFQRIEKAPKGLKAVPILTPTPENTKVTVTDDGRVRMRRGRVVQRFYMVPPELRDEPDAVEVAREMLSSMPSGTYFVLTGEHEAFREGINFDGPDTPDDENLLLQRLAGWIDQYGVSRVGKFFRGFRRIGSADDDAAVSVRSTIQRGYSVSLIIAASAHSVRK